MVIAVDPEFDVFDASADREHHRRALRRLRETASVHPVSDSMFVVLSYETARQVLLDPARFSNVGNFQLLEGATEPEARIIIQRDPPDHTTLRRLELSGFSRSTVTDASPWIEARVAELISRFESRGSAEIVGDLALPLTNHVIARLVGLPTADADQVSAWVRDVSSHRPYPVYDLPSWKSLSAYIWDHVDERRASREPGDDMISRFLDHADEVGISDDEIPWHVYQLVAAGTETTAYTLAGTLIELLRDRTRWERLAADRSLVPAVREEGLRYVSAIRTDFRLATADLTLDGVDIPAGSQVLVSIESANRDDRIWDDPDSFSLDRGDDRRHIAFGYGIHLCLGATLARTELDAALGQLLDRLPGLRLAEGYQPRLVDSSVLNGLERLDVAW